jgi:hypothetical protein
MRYKVKFYQNNNYEVLELIQGAYNEEHWDSVFQGSLSDCEAYIRLHEKGYM